jgi:hypothetical protein
MAELKKILISEVLKDLKSGLTRWKKDDLGFGSLEEKYSLSFTELKDLINHEKIVGVRSKIPTMLIVDDTEDIQVEASDEQQDFQQVESIVVVNKPETVLLTEVKIIKEEVKQPQPVQQPFI